MNRYAPLAAAVAAFVLTAGFAAPRNTAEPNEAGRIMVLMYHRIGDRESTWIRSRDNFRKDLERLYAKGYRPLSLRDLAQNRITTEAGFTPVVLTFDDGWPDHFQLLKKNGKPSVDPRSAVGILEQFSREHPDFPLEATFFLHGQEPFGEKDSVPYKLNYLVSKGMDIGNHTVGHNNLHLARNQSPERIERVIAQEARFLEKSLTEHPGYRIDLFALCNGGRPRKPGLSGYLAQGAFEGYEYRNRAVLNVGGGAAPSPATRAFNPLAIPRIRASNQAADCPTLDGWIRYFDRYPGKRYVSDGNPATVTVPSALARQIDPEKLGGARLVLHGAK